MAEKKYGHFDDANREYVITDPKTPWPWINYLGNEDFFSLISNTAGGYSFYKDASSVASHAIVTMACLWTTAVVTSTSRMVTPSGTLVGNLARLHSTPTSAAMA